MTLQMCLLSITFILFCFRTTLQCQQRNTSCNDIQTDDGYEFGHGGPEGSEIYVYHNKTLIAHVKLGIQTLHPSEVVRMDSHAVITRYCKDLYVQCFVPDGKFNVKEICVEYKIIEKMKNPVDSPTLQDRIIGVSLSVLVLTGICGICCFLWTHYHSWKRDVMNARLSSASCVSTQCDAAPLSQLTFTSYLLTCTCLRVRSSQPEEISLNIPLRCREESEVQDSTADDLETQDNTTNGLRLSQSPCATLPRRSEENINEQDDTLQSVHVDSIDPEADGTTPPSLSLNHNLSNEGIQLSKNVDIRGPDVNRASHHQGTDRNMRDDPGGVNDNEAKKTVCETHSGWTRGDRGPEDQENEGQLLLSSQRAAFQGFDMAGEAAALVNKRSFDRDQLSRCSTAPDADVESTPLNYGELWYT